MFPSKASSPLPAPCTSSALALLTARAGAIGSWTGNRALPSRLWVSSPAAALQAGEWGRVPGTLLWKKASTPDRAAARPQPPLPCTRPEAPGQRASSRSWALGWGGRALVHVTAAVARYSLLRKTVDQFSHGSTGWQGSVTETSTRQPNTGLAFKETGGLGTRSCPSGGSTEGSAHPGGQKGNRGSLPPPLPPSPEPQGCTRF